MVEEVGSNERVSEGEWHFGSASFARTTAQNDETPEWSAKHLEVEVIPKIDVDIIYLLHRGEHVGCGAVIAERG